MKKIMRFVAFTALLAVLGVACNKEQANEDPRPVVPEEKVPEETVEYDPVKYLTGFGADMEATKADLDDVSGNLSWTDGDQVKIIRSDGETALYAYNAGETKFEPVAEPLEKNGSPMHVFFPADNFVWDTDHVQFTMPAAFESLTGIMNPMAAVVPADATAETGITLKNLGGIYEVRLSTSKALGETVTKVQLGNSGVKITGSAAVSFDGEGTPSIGALDGGNNFATLEFASPVQLTATPKSVYFFLPVTATDGFTDMTVKAVFGKKLGSVTYEPYEGKTRKSAMTVTRSMRKHMNFQVQGFFSGGDGLTEATAYQIATAEDFKAIKTLMESDAPTAGGVTGEGTFFSSTGVYYKQTADIDFESNDITANMIGSEAIPFKGTYNGDGKELKNVSINATENFAGVFAYVNGGDEASGCGVKNLKVSGTITSTADAVGGIVGRLQSGTITSCTNTATVTGNKLVGGIVGYMHNGKVSACLNGANITGTGSENGDGHIGGIVGSMRGGTMVDCYSQQGKTIKGVRSIGGLAGYLNNNGAGSAIILNCASASNVLSTQTSGTGEAGGLVGYMYAHNNDGKNIVLANCVALSSSICNTGFATACLGAIVGVMNGAASAEDKSLLRNCYSQHNSTSSTASSVYYSSTDGSTITSTKQTNMGAIYGKRTRGNVKDVYCAGNNDKGYGITGANANVYVGIGTNGTGNGSVANSRAFNNNFINGSGTVSFTSGTINYNSITLASISPINGLTTLMNNGAWDTSEKTARSEYTSSYSTETLSEWVGKGTGTQAYPKTLNDLGYYD